MRSKIGRCSDGNAEVRFSVVGLAVLIQDIEPFEEEFSRQSFPVLAGKVGDLVEDDDQGVGDDRIRGKISDADVVPVFAGEGIMAFHRDDDVRFTGEINEMVEQPGRCRRRFGCEESAEQCEEDETRFCHKDLGNVDGAPDRASGSSIAKFQGKRERSRGALTLSLARRYSVFQSLSFNGYSGLPPTMPTRSLSAPLVIPRPLASRLMRLYDYPHPLKPGVVIRGYDRPHAVRTARMCAAVAASLGHPGERVRSYQIACLLHDLGRAGLDRRLFGKIWSWAKQHHIPTRPREWRALHPSTKYGRETEAFLSLYRRELETAGITMDRWAAEQVEMRLGYARRLARRLRAVRPAMHEWGIAWAPWMQLVMLYYYYPERLASARPWVKQLAEILVACEQFEAYSNRQRGRDYYVREKETLADAFAYLSALSGEGILSDDVVQALRRLAGEGTFDSILEEARGCPLSKTERQYLRGLVSGGM